MPSSVVQTQPCTGVLNIDFMHFSGWQSCNTDVNECSCAFCVNVGKYVLQSPIPKCWDTA